MKAGAFTAVRQQVTLCDPIWQVTLSIAVSWSSPLTAYSTFLNAFIRCQKVAIDGDDWTRRTGKVFQTIAAAAGNEHKMIKRCESVQVSVLSRCLSCVNVSDVLLT